MGISLTNQQITFSGGWVLSLTNQQITDIQWRVGISLTNQQIRHSMEGGYCLFVSFTNTSQTFSGGLVLSLSLSLTHHRHSMKGWYCCLFHKPTWLAGSQKDQTFPGSILLTVVTFHMITHGWSWLSLSLLLLFSA